MIDAQASRRSRSFSMLVLCVAIAVGLIAVVPRMFQIREGSTALHLIMGAIYLCILGCWFFWFKAHYHWSRAKGYSWGLTFLALLGFPVAPIVFACLKDQVPAPPPINDPLMKCPCCGYDYRLGDYRPDAEHIFCSQCKGELSRG